MFVTISGNYFIIFELQFLVEYVLRNLDAIKLKERGRIFRDSFLTKVCAHSAVFLLSILGTFHHIGQMDFGY